MAFAHAWKSWLLAGCLCFAYSLVDGAAADTQDQALQTALGISDLTLVRTYLESGVDPNHQIMGGFTLLTRAVWHGDRGIVELLLGAGADPDIPIRSDRPDISFSGWTPLMVAISKRHWKIADLLLQAGANVHARDPSDRSALTMAISRSNTDLVRRLLARGARSRNMAEELGLALSLNDFVELQKLLAAGAPVNDCLFAFDRASPLQLAIGYGQRRMVAALLDAGAKIDCRAQSQSTPLISAALWGHLDVLELLLASGADINERDAYGRTALMWVSNHQADKVVEFLLKKGADVHARRPTGATALYNAAHRPNVRTVQLLLAAGASFNDPPFDRYSALNAAISSGDMEILKIVLNSGVSVHTGYRGELPPLLKAVERERADMMRLLLEYGARVNETGNWSREKYASDYEGWTALNISVVRGCAECFALLLAAGADPGHRGEKTHTTLGYAAIFNRLDMARELISLGVDIHDGWYETSPLVLAAGEGHLEMVELLLDAGADPNISDADLGALEAAERIGHTGIVDLLRQAGARYSD